MEGSPQQVLALEELLPVAPSSPGSELEVLVFRARGRDATAFTALIRRFERTALSIAFATLGNGGGGSAAGDVTQEAFFRAWHRLGDLKDPARFGTWLCGIVRNLAIDARRRQRASAPLADDASAARWVHNPLEELGRREQGVQVAAALDELDELSRVIVVLRYYEGLASRQIGELLGISPAAVDMRLSRSRGRLRELLSGEE